MKDLITNLNKRRRVIMFLIALFSFLAVLFHYNCGITSLNYFDGKYNMFFTYGLIVYKAIELPILYYVLVHRHLLQLKNTEVYSEVLAKLQKQSKVLFFLIIQGYTIFGIIAYKLSANVMFFLLFMFIALLTILIIKPSKSLFLRIK